MSSQAVSQSDTVALTCKGLTKRFGGLEAVKDVELRLVKGERRAIIGPNGAGKTTLFGLISGLLPVSEGSIHIFGKEMTHLACHRRTALGLGRTFQITNLFTSMTVLENLVIAAMGLHTMKFSMLRPLSTHTGVHRQAMELLERVGMADKSATVVKNLSYGEQRQIEVALALASNPKVLLLDEPAAGLSTADSTLMVEMIRKLDPEITILIIEHDMDVAFEVASRITVLNHGSVFAEGETAEIRRNSEVQAIYFGTEE